MQHRLSTPSGWSSDVVSFSKATSSDGVSYPKATPFSGRLFSSLSYDIKSRLLLVSCRPAPNALHIVMQLAVSRLPGGSRAVVGQVVAQVAGR